MARKKNVLGVAKVLRVFKQLPKENLKRMADVLNRGASEIEALAKTIAAESEPLAGREHYKDTIRKGRIWHGAANARRSEHVGISVYAGGPSQETKDAAFRSEFGRDPSSDGHPGHDPQPALFPAYFSIRKRVRSRIKREVKLAAKAVVARNK